MRPSSRHAFTIALLAALALAAFAGRASAEDVWSVVRGRVIFHVNEPLLGDLGLDLTVAGSPMSEHDGLLLQNPRWAFPIRAGSDFQFKTEHNVPVPGGSTGGALRLDATLTVRDRKSGRDTRFSDLEIVQLPRSRTTERAPEDGPPIVLRSISTGVVFCELVSGMFDFRTKGELRVHYLNARLSNQWAQAIGRPDLAGLVIGGAEIRGAVKLLSSSPPASPPYQPKFAGGVKDIKMGVLTGLQHVIRLGTYPNGTEALSMSTTICNIGTVDVPWLGPDETGTMHTDHPMIHMAVYRLLNGRFEQIGVSWLKHGYFAQSDETCSTCQHPSDGTWLGVGCSDTYGVDNNWDRTYLGPRSEVNAYTGIWTCTGSHFSGGVADCVRRHVSSSGHNAIDHRLIAADTDLNNAGGTYYYEAYYITRGDEDLHNNWASRKFTASHSTGVWVFSTSGTSNPLVLGPTLERWGELRTYANVASDDGEVLLAVQTTDLGGGMYHYEYALLNLTSDRKIRSFSLPVAGVANITNIGFHDNNTNAGDDWQVSLDAGTIRWSTSTYDVNPNANALTLGYMFNFRFDAQAAPSNINGVMGTFKGPATEIAAATRGPFNSTVGVEGAPRSEMPRISGIRPNPTTRSATITFDLPRAGSVKLEIYDAAGRLVRTLMDASNVVGPQTAVWDGKSAGGVAAAAGVYHARLQAGGVTIAKSLVMVR